MLHNCFLMYVKWYCNLFLCVDRVYPNDIFPRFYSFFSPPFPFLKRKRRTKIKNSFSLLPSFRFIFNFLSSISFVLPFFRNKRRKKPENYRLPFSLILILGKGIWRAKIHESVLFNFHFRSPIPVLFTPISFFQKEEEREDREKGEERKTEK